MSEFMGCIRGVYDGKATGFIPGGTFEFKLISTPTPIAHGGTCETHLAFLLYAEVNYAW